jgi:two-component system sensor histidine kinase/response regulator
MDVFMIAQDLTDMQMPIIDSVEAIRVNSLNTDTPLLAMTANAFEEDQQTCLAAGTNAHLATAPEATDRDPS